MLSLQQFSIICLLWLSCHHNVMVLSLQPRKPVKANTKLSSATPYISIEDYVSMTMSSSATTLEVPPVFMPPQRQKRTQERSLEPAIWQLALAGSLATLVADGAMYPLDCIKTLQQSDQGIGLSIFSAAQVLYHQLGGVEAFYRGFLTYAAFDVVGKGAIKFSTYEILKRNVEDWGPSKNWMSTALFACAAMAFISSSLVTVPGELLKQQIQIGHYGGCLDAVSSIWQTSGLAGFYQGYDGVFLRDLPYTAMELGLYDLFKSLYLSKKNGENNKENRSGDVNSENLETTEQIMLAGLTGGIIGYLTTPLDTIKTKLMVDAQFAGSSFATCFVSTIHDHGWESVFCGADARVAWLIPYTAIYLPIYDLIKNKLAEDNKEETTA